MTKTPTALPAASSKLEALLPKLDAALTALAETRDFAKPARLPRVLDVARRVLVEPGGCAAIEARAERLDAAGVFWGSDWATPQILIPSFTTHALRSGDAGTVVIEALSELRLLAVAREDYAHPLISAERARHFLAQVLAINLAMLFTAPSEEERTRQGRLARVPRALLAHLALRIGYEHVIDTLIEEIWRMLRQRPIQTDAVKAMITQISICQANPDIDLGASGEGASQLVQSLFGPTETCADDPGVATYAGRLAVLGVVELQHEAQAFARSMHETGIVSAYHAVLLRHVLERAGGLLADVLGLSSTGRDGLLCYRELVTALIREAIHPATAQGIYGLALLLERGILYQAPVAPALWRQLALPLCEIAEQRLRFAFGDAVAPRVRLLEGVLSMLGQPLGVGQGNNPTCQAARALSMWAYNDPDYLLHLLVWAARDDEVILHFEGRAVSSQDPKPRGPRSLPIDLDPVSTLLVPHLDSIYVQMGALCVGREDDPHRWINPEFHGWWVGRGFYICVDVSSGQLADLEGFLRHFHAFYHPYYNGNQPVIHPQPAGVAVTDSVGRFIGWHAISIQRVALGPAGDMRVYFFNPNNDSGQNWGCGVVVSTSGAGERFGESSLPFEQFASRLYIFHFDPSEGGDPTAVSADEIARVVVAVHASWAANRLPGVRLQALSAP